jgi:hypothetical protein
MALTYAGTHTTSTRPSSASTGDLRFNADTKNMELYDGKSWTIVVDELYEAKLEITTGEEKFGDCYYWVQVNAPGLFSERRQKNLDIHEWVVTTYGPSSEWGYGRWCSSDERYWFKEEKDRSWFILKWTE